MIVRQSIDLTGRTVEDAFAELGALQSYPVYRHRVTSINTGRLDAYWSMLLLPDGLWHAAHVWDAEIGRRWVNLSNETIAASSGREAAHQWQLSRALENLEAILDCLEKDPNNEHLRRMRGKEENKIEELRRLDVVRN